MQKPKNVGAGGGKSNLEQKGADSEVEDPEDSILESKSQDHTLPLHFQVHNTHFQDKVIIYISLSSFYLKIYNRNSTI